VCVLLRRNRFHPSICPSSTHAVLFSLKMGTCASNPRRGWSRAPMILPDPPINPWLILGGRGGPGGPPENGPLVRARIHFSAPFLGTVPILSYRIEGQSAEGRPAAAADDPDAVAPRRRLAG
jgi:hypothetical protein